MNTLSPRTTPRASLSTATLTVLGVLLCWALPQTAQATQVGPGCTLPQAINLRNGNPSHGACTGGPEGRAVILLEAGGDYILDGQLRIDTLSVTIRAPEGSMATIRNGGVGRVIAAYTTVTLQRVRLVDGSASVGGCLYMRNASVTLEDVELVGCSASRGAAIGVHSDGANLTATRVTVTGASSSQPDAYAVECAGTCAFINTTIADNSTGALHVYEVQRRPTFADLYHCTLANNTTSEGPGGILAEGPITIDNTAVSGNTSPQVQGTTSTFGGRYIDDAVWFGPVQDNGGLTSTALPLAGTTPLGNGALNLCLTTDQRGFTRPEGEACDIGAVEIACGNGVLEGDEECDTNNVCDCNAACRLEEAGPDTACDDGNFCTVDGFCSGGQCVFSPRDCNDGLDCTDDLCDEDADTCTSTLADGCLIDGVCVEDGGLSPEASCLICDPNTSTQEYSLIGCLIDGVCVAEGASSPGLTCMVCDPSASPQEYTLSGGCLIDEVCVADGAESPESPCLTCRPGRSTTSYTQARFNTECDLDGLFCTVDRCDLDGACVYTEPRVCPDTDTPCAEAVCDDTQGACVPTPTGCFDDGACLDDGAPSITNPCFMCDLEQNDLVPSPLGAPCADGDYCTVGDACDGEGACTAAARDCDDGLACTVNACDSDLLTCTAMLDTGCLIDGACVADGAPNPDNPCMSCRPELATDAWSLAPLGTTCDDGAYCTVDDACDGAGACVGAARVCADDLECADVLCDEDSDQCVPSVTLGCLIDDACIAEGALSPDNPCTACNPSLDPNAWTGRAPGTLCGEPACADGQQLPAPTCDDTAACVASAPVACPGGLICADAACLERCQEDTHCVEGSFCADDNTCQTQRPLGDACTRDAACASGYCTDGVCCDGRCDGPCQACSPDEGLCTPAEPDTDPDGDCTNGDVCDGAGACAPRTDDVGGADAGEADASEADAGAPDAGEADADLPDASADAGDTTQDTDTDDAPAPTSQPDASGCGCGVTHTPSTPAPPALALLFVLVAVIGRRPLGNTTQTRR